MAGLSFEQLHQKVSARFGADIGPAMPASRDAFCTFAPARLVEICRFLKTTPGLDFDLLQDLTAVDYPKENLIRLVIHFYSYKHGHMFVAKVELPRENPEIDTLEVVWKAANWLEREVFDLFGVNFKGHTDLRRIMLPYDWVGHPLLKDYSEAGGYRDISNIRDNPLDLYLTLDRQMKADAAPAPAPVPVAVAPAAAVAAAVPVPLPVPAKGPKP